MLQLPPILIPPFDPARDARLAAAFSDARDGQVILLFLAVAGLISLLAIIRGIIRLRELTR